jgi:hypothetical protein
MFTHGHQDLGSGACDFKHAWKKEKKKNSSLSKFIIHAWPAHSPIQVMVSNTLGDASLNLIWEGDAFRPDCRRFGKASRPHELGAGVTVSDILEESHLVL